MNPRYLSVAFTTLIGLFSSNMIQVEEQLYMSKLNIFSIGTIVGLLWGFIITHRFINSLFSSKIYAQMLLCISSFSFCILSGGSLFGMMSYTSVQNNPIAILQFMKPPIGGGFVFFVLFNTLMELLFFPLLINRFYNHSKYINRMLFTSSCIYYFSRVWTYVYFAPMIVNKFIPLASRGVTSLDTNTENEITLWIQLSWLRALADISSSFLLLVILSEFSSNSIPDSNTIEKSD